MCALWECQGGSPPISWGFGPAQLHEHYSNEHEPQVLLSPITIGILQDHLHSSYLGIFSLSLKRHFSKQFDSRHCQSLLAV